MVTFEGYRPAAETKFPGAAEDRCTATPGAVDNAAAFFGNPAWVAVGGDSARGNPAAAISLTSCGRHCSAVSFQLLVYPVIE